MFELIEKIAQTQVDNFMRYPALYTIAGIIFVLVYFISKNVRRRRIKKLAQRLDLEFVPYGFGFALFPSLSFLIKRFAILEPINVIEGYFKGKYFIIFDFYYKKLSFIEGIKKGEEEQLVTYVNGKYCRNLSVENIEEIINTNKCRHLEELRNKKDFLKFREIAIMDTYANLKLKGNDFNLKVVEKVLQKFRDVRYSSVMDNISTSWIKDDIRYPNQNQINEIERRIKARGINISNNDINSIINQFLSNFDLNLNINK